MHSGSCSSPGPNPKPQIYCQSRWRIVSLMNNKTRETLIPLEMLGSYLVRVDVLSILSHPLLSYLT